jgi:hypothetical protein
VHRRSHFESKVRDIVQSPRRRRDGTRPKIPVSCDIRFEHFAAALLASCREAQSVKPLVLAPEADAGPIIIFAESKDASSTLDPDASSLRIDASAAEPSAAIDAGVVPKTCANNALLFEKPNSMCVQNAHGVARQRACISIGSCSTP